MVLVNESINYCKAEVSTERENGKYLRLGLAGNTNKSPLHFLCRTQCCGSMGPCTWYKNTLLKGKQCCVTLKRKDITFGRSNLFPFLVFLSLLYPARCLCSMRPFRAKGPLKRYVCFQMPQDEISQDP